MATARYVRHGSAGWRDDRTLWSVARIEYDDGTVMWRRSIAAKGLWAVGIISAAVTVVLLPDIELRLRVMSLGEVALMVAIAWWKVWRPHLAVTPEGLVVRRATSAVLVAWNNISDVRINAYYGISIHVRLGQHINAAVPFRTPLQWLLNLDSDANDAVALIQAKALFADEVDPIIPRRPPS